MGEVAKRVIEVIAAELNLQDENIEPRDRLVEDLGADSLDALSVGMALEDEFKLEYALSDEELAGIVTVADAIALAERKVKESAPAPGE